MTLTQRGIDCIAIAIYTDHHTDIFRLTKGQRIKYLSDLISQDYIESFNSQDDQELVKGEIIESVLSMM